MSLYGGIKFTTAELEAAALKDAQAEKPKASAGLSVSNPKPLVKAAKPSAAILAFAPRVKQAKPSQPTRPLGNYTAAPVIEKKPDLVRSTSSGEASPAAYGGIEVSSKSKAEIEEVVALGQDGRPLARAPAMTLGIAGGEGKDRGMKRDREEEKRRKKKNKKKKQQQQQYMSNFAPDELYDPNRPNDLGEYQAYRKRLRAERKAQLVADKLRKDRGGSSGESSYYSESEEEAPRRDAPKMFAPPRLYTPPASIAPRMPRPEHRPPSPPSSSFTPPPPPSSSAPPPPADDPWARRAAMTQNLAREPSSQNPYLPAAAPPLPISMGYPPAIPGFAPTLPNFAPPNPPATFVPPPLSDIPGFGRYLPPAPPPTAGAPAPPPDAVSNSGDAASAAAAKSLEERKAAAAAIAAKFAALAGVAAGSGGPAMSGGAPAFVPARPAVPREDETGTFAEKMMKRWGHVEGTGIGARQDGIVHALSAEHAGPSVDLSTLSKRAQAKAKAAAANAKKRKWVQAPNARGKIVNANEDLRAAEERDRLGEASRVVCLTGLVEGEEEVDEELSEEVGEECSKWGIVERVVLHMVEPPPADPKECLRVFVVFSGLAGAWRATRELDGRFFGGRKIGVKYFDEAKFNAGDRDGAIS
ncbi:uncharacterized protein MKK02DRAFT_39779 [Dioszegia hungarica]|uniref:RRM domain-containing protein n=1 Tax=Dioszegia hungarica TaxID=4972 RepID=A0AA38LX87_9TREE|nr:uncharacterized protein MKK02DRAFT_39779 [Dioszegia hungarica]KAI9639480.1 hypothetical protein MKK02DRAFT_39779 [Dioszegia hungarica]